MNSIFDLDKLYSLLRDFFEITQIRITIFDENLQELVAYPESLPPFCQYVRSCSKGFDACIACDQNACMTAANSRKTYIYSCHAGLTEAITPLYVGDILVGYLFFGHVFSCSAREAGMLMLRDRCKDLPLDLNKLMEAAAERPLLSRDYVRSATQILHAVASYLVLERMATLREDKLAAQLNAYLSAHYTEKITAQVLCQALGIGKTQLYRLSNQLYGCGVSQQIRKMRLDLAKTLLSENPRMSIGEVAAACGFTDYNYFITVFSREVGCSPSVYRRLPNDPSAVEHS